MTAVLDDDEVKKLCECSASDAEVSVMQRDSTFRRLAKSIAGRDSLLKAGKKKALPAGAP